MCTNEIRDFVSYRAVHSDAAADFCGDWHHILLNRILAHVSEMEQAGSIILGSFCEGLGIWKGQPEKGETALCCVRWNHRCTDAIFYYIRAYGDVQEYVIRGFTFYVDNAMLVVTAIWAVAEVIRFLSSVHLSANLCKKAGRGKGWIVWGFSGRYITEREER